MSLSGESATGTNALLRVANDDDVDEDGPNPVLTSGHKRILALFEGDSGLCFTGDCEAQREYWHSGVETRC